MKRLPSLALLLLLLCGLPGAPAFAAGENCTVVATPLAFGSFTPHTGGTVDVTATVTVTCLCPAVLCLGINYTVAVGTGGSGSFSPRRMSFGTSTLAYNGYDSSAHSTVWGDGTGGTSVQSRCRLAALIGSSWVEPITFYGRIPVSSLPAPGAYTDSLTVTVTYSGISVCL